MCIKLADITLRFSIFCGESYRCRLISPTNGKELEHGTCRSRRHTPVSTKLLTRPVVLAAYLIKLAFTGCQWEVYYTALPAIDKWPNDWAALAPSALPGAVTLDPEEGEGWLTSFETLEVATDFLGETVYVCMCVCVQAGV